MERPRCCPHADPKIPTSQIRAFQAHPEHVSPGFFSFGIFLGYSQCSRSSGASRGSRIPMEPRLSGKPQSLGSPSCGTGLRIHREFGNSHSPEMSSSRSTCWPCSSSMWSTRNPEEEFRDQGLGWSPPETPQGIGKVGKALGIPCPQRHIHREGKSRREWRLQPSANIFQEGKIP